MKAPLRSRVVPVDRVRGPCGKSPVCSTRPIRHGKRRSRDVVAGKPLRGSSRRRQPSSRTAGKVAMRPVAVGRPRPGLSRGTRLGATASGRCRTQLNPLRRARRSIHRLLLALPSDANRARALLRRSAGSSSARRRRRWQRSRSRTARFKQEQRTTPRAESGRGRGRVRRPCLPHSRG